MKSTHKKSNKEAGIALLTTLLLMVLMSAMMVGFMIMVSDGQRLSGMNDDQSRAFYGAESGMEKFTADLGTLFSTTYAPTGAQVDALATQPPVMPASTGITYVDGAGNPAYTISYPKDGKGNPAAAYAQITSGSSPYQGMTAMQTPYTLLVNARTPAGSEVKLQRLVQTVGLPLFQFGVFSETDLGFFPGPNFNFGGRVHTNGNLFLASGGPANATPVDTGSAQLWLAAPVTVVKDVVRDTLSNTHPLSTSSEHPGSVEITTGGTAYQALGFGQGSLQGGLGAPANPNWPSISGSYNGNLRNGVRPLPLTIVLVGNGSSQPVDTVRRPVQGENISAPAVLGERYFSQASLRILLSDNAADITNLPCVSGSAPVNLADLAGPVAGWTTANAIALKALMIAAGTVPLPIATSGGQAAFGTPGYAPGSAIAPAPGDGYWEPSNQTGKPIPTITGYIKIDAQTTYGNPCGNAVDVTLEVLSLGYAGKNLNPVVQSTTGAVAANWAYNGLNGAGAYDWLPALPSAQIAPSTCLDPHPNAVIRLERIRDNASSAPYQQNTGVKGWVPPISTTPQACGVDPATGTIVAGWTPLGTDFWPNVLFDPREGGRRDAAPPAPFNQRVTLSGTMNYIELDVNNLARWFSGTIGKTGSQTLDATTAPNDFAVYISDRRGNFADTGVITGSWPPTSPSGHETGEYGFSDFVNPASLNACPNGTLDTGEDLDSLGSPAGFFTYGENAFPSNLVDSTGNKTRLMLYTNTLTVGGATLDDPNCPSPLGPGVPWPGTYLANANEGRQNPQALFRRAVKLVNGSSINLPVCPTGVSCGLTVTTENPMYVSGNYNGNSAGGGFNDHNVAASVASDAITLLSNNWNDVNSFSSPFSTGGRTGTTTWFRMGVVAGKGASFPIPGWDSTALDGSQDFGTDGGVHNFMRFIENWNSTLNYEGSLVSLFYNRQAVGLYKGGIVYGAPTRAYQFDTNFLNPTLLPPRTPMFRDINTTGFTQLLLPTQ
jgi:hypothetical protein